MAAQSGDSNPGSSEVSLVVRVPTQESELRSVRNDVRSFLGDHCASEDVVTDIELAVSELATNVMQHSKADSVTVAMQRLATGWQIDVHDADGAPSFDDVEKPPSDSVTGRGMFIVQAVMDEVSVVELGNNTIIRCIKNDT